MRIRVWTVICYMLVCLPLYSAEISLQEAEELALERNEVLVSSGRLKERSYQQYLQARSQWYPSVTVSGQTMKTHYANAAHVNIDWEEMA